MDHETKNLVEAAFRSGDYKKALDIASNYLCKVDGNDWDALFMKASIYSSPLPGFTDYHRAIGMVIEGLNNNIKDANRWLGTAEVLENCGIYREAERCYRKVLELEPGNYPALIALSMLRKMPGTNISDNEAMELLTKAISIEPENWFAYHYLAILLNERGDKIKAKEMYNIAINKYSVKKDGQPMYDEMKKQIRQLQDETK